MTPYHFFKINPVFQEIVSLIGVMHLDFSTCLVSPVYRFPWMNNTHLFFPLAEEPLLVKSENGPADRIHTSAYFVGPKLINDVADFGSSRHVVGVTFKPGTIQRLLRIPGKETTNLDIDASHVFGNDIRETEMKLKEAKNNEEILAIIEGFLLQLVKRMEAASPFDMAINELVKYNGNLGVDVFARYACKSIRQLERDSLEMLGMSPRLFARLIRFGKAFSFKEVHPDLPWTSIAHQFGYYDQMHLIKDFKKFMGTTPGKADLVSTSSVKMMAALSQNYKGEFQGLSD
jgi:AraC-like DNA-binding protein